jgi:hypothetical protein
VDSCDPDLVAIATLVPPWALRSCRGFHSAAPGRGSLRCTVLA